jgi:hypothetical protein
MELYWTIWTKIECVRQFLIYIMHRSVIKIRWTVSEIQTYGQAYNTFILRVHFTQFVQRTHAN